MDASTREANEGAENHSGEDKSVSKAPTQQNDESEGARSDSMYRSWSSGSSSESVETEDDELEGGKAKAQDLSWRLSVYRHSPREIDPVKEDTFKQSSQFDIKISASSWRTSGSKRKSSHAARTTCRSVLEVVTHVIDAHRATDRYGDRYRRASKRESRMSPEQLHITRVFKVELVIRSGHLRRVLKSLIEYYPSHPAADFSTSLRVSEPYPLLMHNYGKIEAWIDSHERSTGESVNEGSAESLSKELAHMKILLGFLQDRFESTVKPALLNLSKGIPVITFDLLWLLFVPGEDVYAQPYGEMNMFVIESVQTDSGRFDQTYKSWRVSCWSMATDGHRVARSSQQCRILRFTGLREVLSLPVCPTRIWDAHDGGSRRSRILERNKLHLEALQAGSLHAQYNGKDLLSQRPYHGKIVIDHRAGWNIAKDMVGLRPPIDSVDDRYDKYIAYDHIYLKDDAGYDGSVWFDPAEKLPRPPDIRYLTDMPNSRPGARVQRNYDAYESGYPSDGAVREKPIDLHAKATHRTSNMTEHQLLLLNPTAPAFALSTKQWMRISMEHVRPLSPSPESIDNVVLDDPKTLQTIRALSARQNAGLRPWSADFIEGKGAGQIVLLHGPPGVGKTYTVESIAVWLKRPLLALTVADIGTVETRTETELLKWFDLAESWNAVLLVDEADIFLEQRKNRDLARNGLVSAFLRRMEYFRGLLFLTTNRVGQIDDAFMSRVHVAIGYERLTSEGRKAVWNAFFKKLEKERNSEIRVGKAAKRFILEDEKVQEIELNGREIRNALQTAITLAEYDNLESGSATDADLVVVEEDHFRRVLAMSEKFHAYVTSIRREDEKKRAAARGDRNDYED